MLNGGIRGIKYIVYSMFYRGGLGNAAYVKREAREYLDTESANYLIDALRPSSRVY